MSHKKKVWIFFSFVLVVAVLSAALLFATGILVLDHSGERKGEYLYWNDARYVMCSGEYKEGKTIAKTKDGFRINEVEGDEDHTYVVLRSFLDQQLYVKDDTYCDLKE